MLPLRLVIAHNRYRRPGGEDRVVEQEAELLSRHGHHVTRHLVDNRAGWGGAVDMAKSAWNIAEAHRLREVTNAEHPDVIHLHNTWFRLSPSVVKQTIPVVMTLHNFRLTCSNAQLFRSGHTCRLCIDGSAFNAVRYGCYHNRLVSIPAAANISIHRRRRTWIDGPDLFLALSEFALELMVEAGFPQERIIVKPNFVEDPGPSMTSPAESETVVFLGRVDVPKGVHQLASLWRTGKMPLKLLVVGEGPEQQVFEGIPGVSVTGWLPGSEVRRHLAMARAVVMPSLWYEGQPLSVLEAFAQGRPVVGSDHGGLGETIRPLGAEFLVQPDDQDSLAAALLGLDDDRVMLGGIKARRLYEENYSPDVGIVNLENAYRSAVAIAKSRDE